MATQQHYVLTLLSSLIISCCSVTYLTASSSGKSTYYGGNPSGGACGYAGVATSTFPFGYYAAAGGDIFDNGYGCGKCYEISCIGPYLANPSCFCDATTPTVIIQVRDQCPECSSAEMHFDLDPTAMARIVGDGLSGICGIIETTVRRVECEYNTNIKIRSKSGTSIYWYGLHIDDVAAYGGIDSVSLYSDSSATTSQGSCTKDSGPSFWLCTKTVSEFLFPMTLKLTDNAGNTIILSDCITSAAADTEFECGVNFGVNASPITSPTKPPNQVTTSMPTLSPIIGCTGNLIIRNMVDTQLWWLAFYIINEECCGTVSNVAIKDNVNYISWYGYTDNSIGYWSFDNNGNSFTTPISVQITNSNGQIIVVHDIITNLIGNDEFDVGDSFCSIPTTTNLATTTINSATTTNFAITTTNSETTTINGISTTVIVTDPPIGTSMTTTNAVTVTKSATTTNTQSTQSATSTLASTTELICEDNNDDECDDSQSICIECPDDGECANDEYKVEIAIYFEVCNIGVYKNKRNELYNNNRECVTSILQDHGFNVVDIKINGFTLQNNNNNGRSKVSFDLEFCGNKQDLLDAYIYLNSADSKIEFIAESDQCYQVKSSLIDNEGFVCVEKGDIEVTITDPNGNCVICNTDNAYSIGTTLMHIVFGFIVALFQK